MRTTADSSTATHKPRLVSNYSVIDGLAIDGLAIIRAQPNLRIQRLWHYQQSESMSRKLLCPSGRRALKRNVRRSELLGLADSTSARRPTGRTGLLWPAQSRGDRANRIGSCRLSALDVAVRGIRYPLSEADLE